MKNEMRKLMEAVSPLFDSLEDDHAETYATFDSFRSQMDPKTVARVEKLFKQFDQAYNGQDPYGNEPEDYLVDIQDLLAPLLPTMETTISEDNEVTTVSVEFQISFDQGSIPDQQKYDMARAVVDEIAGFIEDEFTTSGELPMVDLDGVSGLNIVIKG